MKLGAVQAHLGNGKHQGALPLDEEVMQLIQCLGQQLVHQLQG